MQNTTVTKKHYLEFTILKKGASYISTMDYAELSSEKMNTSFRKVNDFCGDLQIFGLKFIHFVSIIAEFWHTRTHARQGLTYHQIGGIISCARVETCEIGDYALFSPLR